MERCLSQKVYCLLTAGSAMSMNPKLCGFLLAGTLIWGRFAITAGFTLHNYNNMLKDGITAVTTM